MARCAELVLQAAMQLARQMILVVWQRSTRLDLSCPQLLTREDQIAWDWTELVQRRGSKSRVAGKKILVPTAGRSIRGEVGQA